MPQSIFHKVGEHLRQQFPIPVDPAFLALEDLCRQRLSVIFGDVRIDFGNGFDDAVDIQIDESRLARAGLDLGDAQKGIEGLIDLKALGAGIRQIVGNRLARGGLVRRRPPGSSAAGSAASSDHARCWR